MPGVLVLISWYLWFLCLGASCIFFVVWFKCIPICLEKKCSCFCEASHQTEPLVLKVLNILMPHLQFQCWNQCVFVVWIFLFNAWIDCVLWVFLDMQRTTRGKEPLHPGFGEAVIRLYKVLPICWRLCHNETYIFRFLHIYIHLHSYIHTYTPTYLHTYVLMYLHTYIQNYMPTFLLTYVLTYLRNLTYLDIPCFHTCKYCTYVPYAYALHVYMYIYI